MNKTNLICIVCPRGCHLQIDENLQVTGNTCKRGEVYAKSEMTNPTRTITSTVKINNGVIHRLPIMTDNPISKKLIFDLMNLINTIEVEAPIKVRDVIYSNVLNTGVNLIATRDIDCIKK